MQPQTRIRLHQIRQTQKRKGRNVKIRKSVVSTEKIMRQIRPQVMTRMTQTLQMTVIIDVSNAGAGKMTRRKTLSVHVHH